MPNDPEFNGRKYGMKKHDATRLHYDLRLEWNGVLLSWALPLGPSLRADVPREAIEMEDHRLSNLSFEGMHTTGAIMLWDCGTWAPHHGFEDVEAWLQKGLLQFALYGERLKGNWTLLRDDAQKGGRRPVWRILKEDDLFAREESDICILRESPNSIATGRSLEEIVREWFHPRRDKRQTELF